MLRIFLLGFTILFATTYAAQAAKITRSDDPECRVAITGEIVEGDFDRLISLKSHLLILGPDGTHPAIICLDSPGGAVSDGIKIAKFVLENGVSTRIRADKSCASICAIIFMMGNVRSAEQSHINRRMHVTSKLGFHRPAVYVPNYQNYSGEDLEYAYDLAIQRVYQLMELATAPQPWGVGSMMEQDLIRVMVGTPSRDMYYVEKIEEIIRWNIYVEGLPTVEIAKGPHLNFACEHTLTKDVILPSELHREGSILSDAVFDLAPIHDFEMEILTRRPEWKQPLEGFHIWSLRYGLTEVWCNVRVTKRNVAVCGVDGDTGLHIGDCEDRFGRAHVPRAALYHPAARIKALAEATKKNVQAAKTRRCETYSSAGRLIDASTCLQVVRFEKEDEAFNANHDIDWPGKHETQITISAFRFSSEHAVTLNGKAARFTKVGANKTCVADVENGTHLCLSDEPVR